MNRPKDSTKHCWYCNKVLTMTAVKYCSHRCQFAYQWSKIVTTVNLTGVLPRRVTSRVARRYLVETRGDRCELCRIASWKGHKIPLVCDHIDGNSDNWAVSNLRMICPNCDALLPTYKGKNRGHGRFARIKRYREGKSF